MSRRTWEAISFRFGIKFYELVKLLGTLFVEIGANVQPFLIFNVHEL
jgi:hypothetical protein